MSIGVKGRKTEHSGAKKGRGAYYGPKRDAKKSSNRVRRREEAFRRILDLMVSLEDNSNNNE